MPFSLKPVPALVAGLALALPSMARAESLAVGSPAPTFKVAKWVKGKPIEAFEAGKLYVVEFWATWCGPCKVSIPHLTELAKKNPDVSFIGVDIWESNSRAPLSMDQIQTKVNKFVEGMGAKMDYNVVIDDAPENGTMATKWMKDAGQNGIPTAFVVGKDGKIAWIGHPMELGEVLPDIVADKFDSKAFADQQAKKQADAAAQQAKMRPMQEKGSKVIQLAQAGKTAEALAGFDAFAKEFPEVAPNLGGAVFGILLKKDEAGAYAFAKKLTAGPGGSNPMLLNQLAWPIVDDESHLKTPDYKLAVLLAEKAVALTKGEDPMILDTLGYAYYKSGNRAKAIATQEKAVALLAKMSDVDPEMKKEISGRLLLFKSKK